MNEMDLLTRMREEIPIAPASARAEGVLLAAVNGGKTHVSPHGARPDSAAGRSRRGWRAGPAWPIRPAWRIAVAAGLCLALGAGATAGLALRHPAVPLHHSATAGHHPGTPGVGGVALTAQVLATRAARAAAAGPAVSPHQWFYVVTVFSALATRVHLGKPQVYWQTADHTEAGFYDHGKVRVFPQPRPAVMLPYSAVVALPRDPVALVRYLGHRGLTPGSHIGFALNAMSQIESFLSTYVMSPRLTAELYRALGDIPGIQVRKGLADVEGRRGTGFILRQGDGSFTNELILNPRTYAYMGSQILQPVHGVVESSGTATLLEVRVSGPGVRP